MCNVFHTESVDKKLIEFNSNLSSFYHKNSKCIIRRIKRPEQPLWFTKDIQNAIKLRDKYKADKDFSNYRMQRNSVVIMIKYAKGNFYKEALVGCKGNSRKMWKLFNEAIGRNRINVPMVLSVDCDLITDSFRIAALFNEYFSNIASKILHESEISQDSYTPSNDFTDFLNNKLEGVPKFSIPHITPDKIKSALKNMNPNKSVGLDDINLNLLRLNNPNIVLALCNIINTSLADGTFPTLWKSAKVFALHKGGSRTDCNNYRPVSVLSISSKIIERHVHDSFTDYLYSNSLINSAQSGFKKLNSCFTCLSSMIDEWLQNLNNNKIIGYITLDFRKAFDILPHDILVKKLTLYGCDNLTVSWFQTYLENRNQIVQINGNVRSSALQNKYGVPQGSILGPLLFVLFLNDIIFEVEYCNLSLYADDSNLYRAETNISDLEYRLNHDLGQIETWCANNHMVINTAKSKCMLICSPQRRRILPSDKLNLCIYGMNLENVDQQKVLGLIIDNNLTWRSHIQNLQIELTKLIGLLWRKRRSLPFASKILFYNSFILPKIDYCLPIWGNASRSHLDNIWRLQKRAIRIICNAAFDAPTRNLFLELKQLNIHQRCVYQLCLTTFRILHDHGSPLYHIIHRRSEVNALPYFLRASDDRYTLHVPFPHKEMFKSSLSYSCPFQYNKLPLEVKSSQSVAIFKYKCKHHIMSTI
jgi:hypothetical protein